MEIKNMNAFVEKFNNLVNNPDCSQENKKLIETWKTHFALAFVHDFGLELADDVSSIISSICTYEDRKE